MQGGAPWVTPVVRGGPLPKREVEETDSSAPFCFPRSHEHPLAVVLASLAPKLSASITIQGG